ncbi:unnamed protein product [Ectocarpus sp. 12 AP-2014]
MHGARSTEAFGPPSWRGFCCISHAFCLFVLFVCGADARCRRRRSMPTRYRLFPGATATGARQAQQRHGVERHR